MIDDVVRQLATGPNFATITTLLPDGTPQTHVMWVDCDDEHVLVNTEVHRSKYRNTEHDPRVTVTIMDRENPYHYAEVRGRVAGTVRGDEARRHIDTLSQKYLGSPYDADAIQSERVILRIAPERQRSQ
ncbi:MAG TPA: PPOX class F420-dependent oxidoreductase [Acidimicrobiales bacterium]|nr:PPOX class F420-dependent oxidoreductase [Acidimicrobiales bacterium]